MKTHTFISLYNVYGTFSYIDMEDGKAKKKTVGMSQEAYSEKDAADKVIQYYKDYYYSTANWLIGEPSVRYIRCAEFYLATYWTRKTSEKNAILEAVQKGKYKIVEDVSV